MVYILTLTAPEEAGNRIKFQKEKRLTKTYPRRIAQAWKQSAPWIALILSYGDDKSDVRYLKWMGAVSRTDTPGQLDYSVTIDPLEPCLFNIPIDGSGGLLAQLPSAAREEFTTATAGQDVTNCSEGIWEAFNQAIRRMHPEMSDFIDWITAAGTPPKFNRDDAADRSWQEQRDCAFCLSRIAGLPPLTFAPWHRPSSPHEPYLAGVLRKPYEQGMIEHDATTVGSSSGMFNNWFPGDSVRYDIHVIKTGDGRRLEVLNVNDTPIEYRTGTDMIYYHEPTHSFVLVQYKRLESKKKPYRPDARFYSQLDRLEKTARLSKEAAKPRDWRLGRDSCFMKLAHWSDTDNLNNSRELANGMYLPVSYIRMLLKDDSTQGALGYDNVERHLVGRQFIELVTHGLVGSVGVSAEELHEFVYDQVTTGQSVMVGVESSPETVHKREQRLRTRSAPDRSYKHAVITPQQTTKATAGHPSTLF